MSTNDPQLNDCGCCEGVRKLTPVTIKNSPGLSTLKYRVGTHSQFKTSMIASISQQEALQNLRTREDDDLTIAIFDAWATVADVLTFYQERIANEGLLRTATERRSLLELARSVGYELRPGVAASTFLAFTVEDTIESTIVNEATKVQSLPGEGETPQIFETVEEIEAHAEWNKLKPITSESQSITADTTKFYFTGTNTQLKLGNLLLVVQGHSENAVPIALKTVVNVEEDAEAELTIVDVVTAEQVTSSNKIPPISKSYIDLGKDVPFKTDLFEFTTSELKEMTSKKWTKSDLNAFEAKYDISSKDFFNLINKTASQLVSTDKTDIRVYALRIRVGIFGHNAAIRSALPTDPINLQTLYGTDDVSNLPITYDDLIYLDNSYPDVVRSTDDEDSWIVLQSPSVTNATNIHAYRITGTNEETKAEFLLTAKVTGLAINRRDDDLSGFKIRKTTAFVKSERLEVDEIPIEELIEGNSITLDRAVDGLSIGQLVSVTGEPVDEDGESKGITSSEIATISNIELDGLYTKLTFEKNLDNSYKRDTVTLNVNVARATHGETKEEALGGGDPSKRQQQFALKQTPLTYISASTASGVESTLKVHVDDVLWKEVSSLYSLKPEDRAYMVRIDDDGETRIIFGDGIKGTRPAAGTENIKARYRVGIGTSGILKEEQLSLLMSRPLGVRSVTNPIAPTGADDPEDRDSARENAPLTVLTMDRIVSLKDVENFALAFAGIGKAQAIWIWDGEKRIVYLTVASATGSVVDEESDLYQNLTKAIDAYKDPQIQVKVKSFTKKLFNVEAKIAVAEDRDPEDVFLTIKETLQNEFSFESMQFGQPVTHSKVMSVIQGVEGVVAVDMDYLYIYGEESTLNNIIAASTEDGELLILNPDGVTLTEMKV